jgi:hypothetical protein
MITLNSHCAHSADVTIRLLIDGNWLPVAQLGPEFLLLDGAADIRRARPLSNWDITLSHVVAMGPPARVLESLKLMSMNQVFSSGFFLREVVG